MDNISLSPDVKNFLQNQISAGIYKSLSEVINANISILILQTSMAKNRKASINAEIKKGLNDVAAGRIHDGLNFMDDLIAKYE